MLRGEFFPDAVGADTPEVTAAPAAEALTLAQAKLHLRVDDDTDDELIEAAIVSAREALEKELDRPLLPQTCVVRLDEFPRERILLWSDVLEVVSIKYTDLTGAAQQVDVADIRLRRRAYIVPRNGWPKGEGVEVTFKCGAFDSPDAVPESCCSWMKLVIGTLYEQRESETAEQTYSLPGRFVAGLIDRYRNESL
ncbi:hypothetical protein G5S35_08240 [Paraburkholderia tropica]|uniref:head-tail connector protein n=1 Tax=Paraburkholderia tropica TaxID=92647 RepID=UPI001603ADAA|nr:head-tail connector protein [Paraburkholderia tropica]QNB11568.1 hypothetical protein G5S35_08240 [Paraburkholderia tropica]